MEQTPITPVAVLPDLPVEPAAQRIVSIDALRGFAVLGILIMNIQSFSMIEAAYMNPTAYGDLTGVNRWVWILSHLLAREKFMGLFSMLFGAGIVLFTSRIEARGESARGFHYRRNLWLLVIGLLHAHLFWYGDILFTYAVCAFIVYLFRKRRPRTLLSLGLSVLAVGSLLFIAAGLSMRFWPPDAVEQNLAAWRPAADPVEKELAAYRGGWLAQMSERMPQSLLMETFILLFHMLWVAGGRMLIGMALFKWGILSGGRTRRFYAALAALCLGIGLPIIAWGIRRDFAEGWRYDYSMFFGSQYNYWGSILVSLGYIGIVMLVTSSACFRRLTATLAAVGRMAFTNYLTQTAICTTIFYGHGFGLFGKVERIWQIAIVLPIWAAQLAWSPLWLRRFRFGPFEWLWRSLTYRKQQPMRTIGSYLPY